MSISQLVRARTIMAVIAIVVFFPAVTKCAEDAPAPATVQPVHTISHIISTFPYRLHGLFLVAQLRPGMTSAEFDPIIGNLVVDEGQFSQDGSYAVFRAYGFSVSEARDQAGVLRLQSVTLLPLQ